MSGYTQGPWVMNGADIEALVDPENSSTYYAPICTMAEGWRSDTEDANARLIAAAPSLLVEAIELLRNATYTDGYATVLTQDCEALEAAIAKAKGE